jgi:CheY-like chemotaxis protein
MSVESAPPPLFDNRPSVVFADDDPVIRSYLCLQLLQSFDLAGVARNASEAIAVVAERQPDLVILDVHMPGGGGWHATREIRRRSPRTAIVVLSADEARTEVNELLRLGAVTYMRKGIEPQALMDTLNFALEAHHNGLAAAAAAQPHSPHPVLVAEDDPINEFAVTEILRRLGYRVDVARNGLEAVEMAAARDYAAVFMDCQMPQLDGFDATAEIRRTEASTRHTPIIAMTAHDAPGDRLRCFAAGMDNYVSKPLRLDDVARACAGLRALSPPPQRQNCEAAALFDPAPLFEIATSEQASELIATFIAEMGSGLSAFAEAEATDGAQAATFVHRLRGSAATIGARRLAAMCDALEGAVADAESGRVAELHSHLIDTAGDTAAAMRHYLETIAPGQPIIAA